MVKQSDKANTLHLSILSSSSFFFWLSVVINASWFTRWNSLPPYEGMIQQGNDSAEQLGFDLRPAVPYIEMTHRAQTNHINWQHDAWHKQVTLSESHVTPSGFYGLGTKKKSLV